MEVYQGNQDYIALCFAADDRETAEKLVERLSAERLRVWSSRRGCSVSKKSDAARLAGCCTAIILISAAWLENEKNHAQLRAAAEAERQTVLLFLDGTDLSGNEELSLLLSRSVRMLDYSEAEAEDCIAELLSLMCIQDCKMADGEEPDTKQTSFWDFLS